MSKEKLVELLENVDKALKRSASSPWDEYVPFVSHGSTHTAFLTNEIGEPSLYNHLCYKLMVATDQEEFNLIINSPGGILDSAFMIADAIEHSKAKVKCKLAGTVASAATIITMSCKEIETSNNLAFMIHNYSSSGAQGKGHEMKARQTFIDRELNKSFKKYYLGFLSAQEIEDVIEGKDIWLNSEEVEERWQQKRCL